MIRLAAECAVGVSTGPGETSVFSCTTAISPQTRRQRMHLGGVRDVDENQDTAGGRRFRAHSGERLSCRAVEHDGPYRGSPGVISLARPTGSGAAASGAVPSSAAPAPCITPCTGAAAQECRTGRARMSDR